MTYFTGDTVRFTSTFEDLDEDLTDADGNVTFKAYDSDTESVLTTATAIRDSVGTYHYDYTFSVTPGSFVIEMSGMFSGKPQLQRLTVKSKFKV